MSEAEKFAIIDYFSNYAEINQKKLNAIKNNALGLASEIGNLEDVIYLIEVCKANIHSDKDYAFRIACEKGYLNIVQYLLTRDANIHANKDYALRKACENGFIDIVRCLIEKNNINTINYTFYNNHGLWMAAYNGHFEIVRYLIEHCEFDGKDPMVLLYAARQGHMEIVRYLIEQCGADACADRGVAFRYAAGEGHLNVVQYIVEKISDSNTRNALIHVFDDEALNCAHAAGHTNVVEYLLQFKE